MACWLILAVFWIARTWLGPNCLKTAIHSIVDNTDTKLISQSYDRASVMSGLHAGVQTLLKELYPDAYYVHCQNQRVRIFFSNLSDLTNSFTYSPERIAVLKKGCQQKNPSGFKYKVELKNLNCQHSLWT